MRQAVLGLILTAVVGAVSWQLGGEPAAVAALAAGVLATGIETLALRLLVPALVPPFERLVKRWAYGLALRLGGVGLVGMAVVRWPAQFPPLPTALGFVAVLIPLLFGEMRLVVTRLRTAR
jgi:hypothetical protein